jgi:arylsulfatase A-like enzyme
VDFLSQRDRKHPFLLAVGFQDPHHPHCLPRDFSLRLDPQAVPLPQAEEGDLEHMPPHYLEARCGLLEKSAIRGKYWVAGQGPGADFRQVSEADARLGRAYYYSMVRSIDQQVGRILDCLKECNLAQNTIVVFTTDHGELLGDHGLWMKGPFHYEPLIRVPLLLRWPEGIPGGQRLSSIASHVDLAPTLLAACGLAIAEDFDGLDALPLLQGKAPAGREAALVEFVDDPGGLRLKTMVTQRWKLTWYARKPYGELLDLDSDPQERTNLWDDPNFAPVKASLLARLLDTTERLERRAERDCYA